MSGDLVEVQEAFVAEAVRIAEENERLRAQVASLQKELAERTAERDRYLRDAGKHFAETCKLADRALTAESRADTLARRVEGLEAALENIVSSETGYANATVKRIVRIADAALTGEQP